MTGQVPLEIQKWTRVRRDGTVVESPALVARRRAEAELFTGGTSGLAVPASREVRGYAYQQNPAVAAIGLAEAVEWGLAAGAIVQSGVQASSGSFALTYDDAHRLLSPPGRLGMPGAPAAIQSYRRTFLTIPSFRLNAASAVIDVVWRRQCLRRDRVGRLREGADPVL